MKTENLILSITENGYSLIYEGLPLCNDKQTLGEIDLVAKMYKCDLPKVAWNGTRAQWVTTSTICTENEAKND
jgi:hypothetical protein